MAGTIFDLVFEGISAFGMIGFFTGALVMTGIGALILYDTLRWRLTAKRVRARIVAVRSTGTRRSDAQWEAEYANSSALAPQEEADFTPLLDEIRKKPLSAIPAFFTLLVMVLVPFVFMGFGTYMVLDYMSLKSHGLQAQATVVRLERVEDSDGGTTYAPVLRFTDAGGHTGEYKDRMSSSSASSYKKGMERTVYYDPEKPSHFVMDSFWRYAGFGLAFAGIGGAVFVLLFGGLLMKLTGMERIKDPDAKRREARKALEKIRRQHRQNQTLSAVYEYAAPDGTTVRATENGGASWLGWRLPGREVTVMVHPGHPGDARRPGMFMIVLSFVFIAPGLLFFHLAAAQFRFSLVGIGVILAALGWAGWKLKAIIKPRSQWESVKQFRARMDENRAARAKTKAEAGYEMTPAEIADHQRMTDRQVLLTMPFLALVAVGLMVGGIVSGQGVRDLEKGGIRTPGEVVAIDTSRDSDGDTMYYARIGFETKDGARSEFRDNTGASNPLHRTGDRVIVLYDPANPAHAVIDRKWMNWLLPFGLLAAGLLLGWWSLTTLAASAARAAKRR